jgi:HlyD family secretion protein
MTHSTTLRGDGISQILSGVRSRLAGLPAFIKHPRHRPVVIGAAAGFLILVTGATWYGTVLARGRAASAATAQTTVVRRGDIVLSASGSGTLQAAQQKDLNFGATGKLAVLNVRVGDQVTEGQLLAELDNTSQQLSLKQAQQALDALTSTSAIGAAQKSLAAAQQKLKSAQLQVEYLVSPDVYYWENEVANDQRAQAVAQEALAKSPGDPAVQKTARKAGDLLGFAQDKLKDAHKNYHDYVLDTFTVTQFDRSTDQQETYIAYPTAAEILSARQDVTIAQGAVEDAQNLYSVLTGGPVPVGASGSGLKALEQARLKVKTAQEDLLATQIHAPFAGTVVSVNAAIGPVGSVPTPSAKFGSGSAVRSTAILSIADLSKLYVKTYIDESDYASLKVGNQAKVVFDALPDRTFTGKVVEVDPTVTTSGGSTLIGGLVELDPESAVLLLGMTASVDLIQAQSQNAILVPLSALHEYAPGKYAVFVQQDGKLSVRFVQVGLEDLINSEITSGLQPGEVVSTGLLATR